MVIHLLVVIRPGYRFTGLAVSSINQEQYMILGFRRELDENCTETSVSD